MKKLLFCFLLFSLVSFSFASNTLECQFRDNSCLSQQGEVAFLYANKNFYDSNDRVLSSHIAISSDEQYSKFLCCKSPFGNLDASFVEADEVCDNGESLMYFLNSEPTLSSFQDINHKARFEMYEILTGEDNLQPFNLSKYKFKSCVSTPEQFSLFDVVASDRDYSIAGYECMYRISDLENGLVSDCDATFNGFEKYEYAVWGRLWEDISSLNCNFDCTSKLDGRVYSACRTQVKECRGIPEACNGALLNTWVSLNEFEEFLCAPPWNISRSEIFTSMALEVSSNDSKCENIFGTNYPIFLGNRQVNMKIYVCDD